MREVTYEVTTDGTTLMDAVEEIEFIEPTNCSMCAVVNFFDS